MSPFLPPWWLPGAFQAVQMALSCLPGPNGPFVPPWRLPGASQAVQLVLSYLPGASQAIQLVLFCFPGASLVPPRLSIWSFPASLAPCSCPTSPFLPPWCLPGCPNGAGGPGTSQAVQMVFPWRLAVSRASKIKSGLGRLVESFPVHPLQPVPWSLPGCLRGPRAPGCPNASCSLPSLLGCPYRYLAPAGLSTCLPVASRAVQMVPWSLPGCSNGSMATRVPVDNVALAPQVYPPLSKFQ